MWFAVLYKQDGKTNNKKRIKMEKMVKEMKKATISKLKKEGWKEQDLTPDDMKWGHTRFTHLDCMDIIYANEFFAMYNHKFFLNIKKTFRKCM